jgi:hypothetical protein
VLTAFGNTVMNKGSFKTTFVPARNSEYYATINTQVLAIIIVLRWQNLRD